MSSLGISAREFARRSDCDVKQVRRAISSGKLKRNDDGTLDPSQLEIGWRKPIRSSRSCGDKKKVSSQMSSGVLTSDEPPAIIAARIVTEAMELLPLAEAIQLKENYNARLKQLEYDKLSGEVVLSDAVLKEVGEEYAKVRTRLLAIPSEQAPRIHRLKTVAEVHAVMQEIIIEALEELTMDEI